MGFRTYLEQAKSVSGRPLGKSTMLAILATLHAFVLWLSQQMPVATIVDPDDWPASAYHPDLAP